MLGKVGNKNFSLLGRMLDLTAASHRIHSQNVANVNVPNYKRRHFRFDTALKEAMREGTAESYESIQGWVDRPRNTPVRNNGNNVDIDKEMFDMQENAKLYEIYTNLYNQKSEMLSRAIRGGR
ncbi:MAG: flagellar biosynthesis protein FlgB [Chlamydiales bacterium]|nr:flagellar biosynthesis protein FlgB [Chlamydiales bacterium]